MKIFMIQRFGVYYCKSFQFPDGSSKNKFFISLNCEITELEINLLLPTSRYDKYSNNPIYLMDTVVIKENESQFFTKITVIDLKNILRVKSYELKSENIIYKGLLEKCICKRIEDVIKNSKLLSPKQISELLCKDEI